MLRDAREMNAPGTDGDQEPTRLVTYVADGLIGALSDDQWTAFMGAGYVYGTVYDVRTREPIHPDAVIRDAGTWRA